MQSKTQDTSHPLLTKSMSQGKVKTVTDTDQDYFRVLYHDRDTHYNNQDSKHKNEDFVKGMFKMSLDYSKLFQSLRIVIMIASIIFATVNIIIIITFPSRL